jgi:hypothetical protein
LAVGMKTEMVATGGTDAVLNLWHDCTMEDKQEDFRKKASETCYCYTLSIYNCKQDACFWKKNYEISDVRSCINIASSYVVGI